MGGFANNDILNDIYIKNNKSLPKEIEVNEAEKEYKLSVGLPGFSPEDVRVDIYHDKIQVQAQHDPHMSKKFEYSFRIPEEVEIQNVEADFHDEKLEVGLPKK